MKMMDLVVNSELGKALIEKAKERRNEAISISCIDQVQTTMQLIDITKLRIEEQKTRLDIYERRLKAYESGAIKLEQQQNGQMLVVFKDEALRPENQKPNPF